jgi:hypothetical protein
MFTKLKDYLDNVYWCVIPFATYIVTLRGIRYRKRTFDAMQTVIEYDDAAFGALKRLRFAESEKNLDYRVIVPRGKYCADDLLPEFVEIEVETYFYEQLVPLMNGLMALSGDFMVAVNASYIQANDTVLVTVGPDYTNDETYSIFKSLNKYITFLYFVIAAICIYKAC